MLFKRFLVLFVLFPLCSFAQNEKLAGYGIEVNPVYGKIIKHNYIFPPLPDHSYALDVNILKRTAGKKEWQQRRNNPLI
ncbi:MAG: hypothetical protein H6550_16585, partial [Chitinophagales bacterium]|nr:hypothetical protein [Chitinophagales bacterium]